MNHPIYWVLIGKRRFKKWLTYKLPSESILVKYAWPAGAVTPSKFDNKVLNLFFLPKYTPWIRVAYFMLHKFVLSLKRSIKLFYLLNRLWMDVLSCFIHSPIIFKISFFKSNISMLFFIILHTSENKTWNKYFLPSLLISCAMTRIDFYSLIHERIYSLRCSVIVRM